MLVEMAFEMHIGKRKCLSNMSTEETLLSRRILANIELKTFNRAIVTSVSRSRIRQTVVIYSQLK